MRKDVTWKKNESHKLIGGKQERWKVKRKKYNVLKRYDGQNRIKEGRQKKTKSIQNE